MTASNSRLLVALLASIALTAGPAWGETMPAHTMDGLEHGGFSHAGDCCWGAGLFWVDPCPVFARDSGMTWPHCQNTYDGYPPTSYAHLEYLALFRDVRHPEPTLAPSPSFDGDFASGALVTLGTALAPNYRLETTWFGSHAWSDSALVGNAIPAAFASELDSVELLLRHRVDTPRTDFAVSYSIGARFIQFRDELFVAAQSARTDNDLLGLEGGLLLQFLAAPRTWVDWEMKGALANNDATVAGVGQESATSIIGETSLTANYQFLPSVTFRIGYRGMWLTGMALAEENFGNPLLVNDSGEVVFHGLNVGLVYAR